MKPIQFYAYHGTSMSKATKIIETQNFLPGTKRNDHWLGYGSYFFREDYEQALVWAKIKNPRKAAVIEANINIANKHYLNLDSIAGLQFLKDHISFLIKEKGLLIEGSEEDFQSPALTCLVFSAIDPNIKWVIFKSFPVHNSRFSDDEDLRKISFEHRGELMEFGLQGPQVCVRNNEAIHEISIQTPSLEKSVENIVVASKRRGKIPNDLFNK